MKNTKQTNLDVVELLNGDSASYLEFAKFLVVNRSLPHITDGFKPTARKIIFVSLNRAKKSMVNVAALSGYVKAEAKYHSGDTNIPPQIINLSQDFKVAIPYFETGGQFGNVYSPEAAQPRYLGVKLSNAFNMLFLDNDIIEEQYEEGSKIEPVNYYPILANVLLTPINGIAVAYSFESYPRSPIDLLDATVKLIKGQRIVKSKPIAPYISGLIGDWVFNSKTRKWEHHGIYEKVNTTTIKVSGLPYTMTESKFEEHLNNLCDDGHMVDFRNLSSKGIINYELKFTRALLSEYIKDGKLPKLLKLEKVMKEENLTVITVDDKPKRFTSDYDLIKEFIDYRLTIYTKRISNKIIKIQNDISLYDEIIKFIKLVNTKKIQLDKIKSKSILIEELTNKHKFKFADKLAELKVYKLTKEEIDAYLLKIKQLKTDLNYYKKVTEHELYLEDLANLKKELTKSGYKKQVYKTI